MTYLNLLIPQGALLFLFKQLQKRHNLQYLEIRDDAMKIRGHVAQGLRSPSPSPPPKNKRGDQEPVIHPDSGNKLPGPNANPVANKRNEVTVPDSVTVSSTKTPEKTPSSISSSESTRSTSESTRSPSESTKSADKSNGSPKKSDGISLILIIMDLIHSPYLL